MVNTVFRYDEPANEPVKGYAPGSPEAQSLQATLKSMSGAAIEVPCIVGGEEVFTGQYDDVIGTTLGRSHDVETQVIDTVNLQLGNVGHGGYTRGKRQGLVGLTDGRIIEPTHVQL